MPEEPITQISEMIVLGSHLRLAPGSTIALEAAPYQEWRMRSLDVLKGTFGGTSLEYYEFLKIVRATPHQANAAHGLGILEAAKAIVEAGFASPDENRLLELDRLPLHPRIADIAVAIYNDGHYEDAVRDSCIALKNLVQERSGKHDLDGSGLMTRVFSKNSPILAFNDLSTQTDLDEQEGMMHLYMGATMAVRNPRSHGFTGDSPERALEYICFISMLANRLEDTTRIGDVSGAA